MIEFQCVCDGCGAACTAKPADIENDDLPAGWISMRIYGNVDNGRAKEDEYDNGLDRVRSESEFCSKACAAKHITNAIEKLVLQQRRRHRR